MTDHFQKGDLFVGMCIKEVDCGAIWQIKDIPDNQSTVNYICIDRGSRMYTPGTGAFDFYSTVITNLNNGTYTIAYGPVSHSVYEIET